MLEANASVPLTASAVNFLTFWKDQKHLLQKKKKFLGEGDERVS